MPDGRKVTNEIVETSKLTVPQLEEAFPEKIRGEARRACVAVEAQLGHHAWTERFSVVMDGCQVIVPARLKFMTEASPFAPGSADWLMMRAFHSRDNDGFKRQRAAQDILTDVQPWTAPFLIALAGEYVAEIVIDIERGLAPASLPILAGFIAENPAYWATTKRRIQSYWNLYYRNAFARSDYAGFRLIERLETCAAASSRDGA